MEETYLYENAEVTVVISKSQDRIREATEIFLKKIIEEESRNGNNKNEAI